jgi:phospholipase/lecithinase/hemolysin
VNKARLRFGTYQIWEPNLIRFFVPLAMLLVSGLAQANVQPSSFSKVVVFGDSLSDNGNLLTLSAPLVGSVLPFGLPPAPYYQGRFSNGMAAVEYLAQGLGAPLQNFAVGGATTGLTNNQVPAIPFLQNTGLLSQVTSFTNLGAADSNALYVVWAGANDFLNPSTDPNAVVAQAIGNLTSAVGSLYAQGARSFLLPLLPDLGLTPRLLSQGPLASGQASALTDAFNSALGGSYQSLLNALPGAQFTVFDVAGSQRALVANAAALGFSNTSTGCFSGFVDNPVGTVCATPASYAYWDEIHPSARVHEILGAQMLAAAVPEPSTYALMALGLLGIALRRRAN